MTRLYTDEFRCSVCFREGSLGWLWRCTQDRELLLEDDLDRGFVEKFDDLNENFELSKAPKKRSPAARMSKLSFLEEISDEELKNYSSAQVHQILKQRSDKERPVADVDVVKGLGLRPCPVTPKQEMQEKTSRQSLLSNRTADSTTSTMPSIGLGILGTERPHTHIPSIATVLTANKGATSVAPPPGFPPQTHRPLPILPYESTTTTSIKAEDNTGANTNKPLPNLPNTKPHLTISTNTYHPSRPELPLRQMPSFSRACTTPLPLSTAEEEELMGRPLTPMEKDEASKGKFGNLPLDVGTGVAVTEEGVGGHWADVVTQF
ncbi:hypothetical protein G7Y89_g3569 [Cudoniella acicularis]|uniref:Uncharacterized protein n=1 Tax=Cudoniella acicularis TaxID=354080 RepID=A0A8H4RT47_9HELO|nr:hypothetical protein G7Y89_g3569 [Cudoniella acicularis]